MQFSHAALNRRAFLACLTLFATSQSLLAYSPISFADEWHSFKSRFLSKDGRIIDTGNGGVSHSEGQGWGLLFAVAAQDQESFDLILNWTAQSLRRPTDALHAWRYVPLDHPPVKDANNAVDGDMFIATALIRAGRLWGRPDHLLAAAAIGRDILRLLVRNVGPFTVLLPGLEGFETRTAIVINPSYYAFPMMSELAKVVPSEQWDRLQQDGKTLIETGRFGRWSLPPDWLRIAKKDATLSPAPGWPPRFSYDAIRVPLWWVWQKLPPGSAIQAIEQFWRETPTNVVPAWVDLRTNEAASYQATPGIVAVSRLVRLAFGDQRSPDAPVIADTKSYYDASLVLLSHIAEREMLSS
jgi:endo-1,4-beta-D-glucanase Y